jgi:hypothetical protein
MPEGVGKRSSVDAVKRPVHPDMSGRELDDGGA